MSPVSLGLIPAFKPVYSVLPLAPEWWTRECEGFKGAQPKVRWGWPYSDTVLPIPSVVSFSGVIACLAGFRFTQHLAEILQMMPVQVVAVSWKWRPTVLSSGKDGRRPSCPAGWLTVVLGWSATDMFNNVGPCVCSSCAAAVEPVGLNANGDACKNGQNALVHSVKNIKINHHWWCSFIISFV